LGLEDVSGLDWRQGLRILWDAMDGSVGQSVGLQLNPRCKASGALKWLRAFGSRRQQGKMNEREKGMVNGLTDDAACGGGAISFSKQRPFKI